MNYPLRVVNKNTIIIDGGSVSTFEDSKVRDQACMHFFDAPSHEKVGRGTVLWGNMLNFYHVRSVRYGLVVVSKNELTPAKTRPIARRAVSRPIKS